MSASTVKTADEKWSEKDDANVFLPLGIWTSITPCNHSFHSGIMQRFMILHQKRHGIRKHEVDLRTYLSATASIWGEHKNLHAKPQQNIIVSVVRLLRLHFPLSKDKEQHAPTPVHTFVQVSMNGAASPCSEPIPRASNLQPKLVSQGSQSRGVGHTTHIWAQCRACCGVYSVQHWPGA